MNEFPINTLAHIIKADLSAGFKGTFTGVSTDSRTIKPGDCFFAATGERFNGADFLAEAFAKGAACAVVNGSANIKKYFNRPILKVDDCIRALGDFAAQYRQQAGFKVVAITGSTGKTTTRQIVWHVLSRHFQCRQAPKNFNNNIGLPLALLGADRSDQIVIVELGSNHPGEIAYLTEIARPDVAVVTNVYPAHLAGFGDLETIIREKLSIAQGLKSNGALIINGDFDRLVDACRAGGGEFTTFGTSVGCDIKAEDIVYNGFGSSFKVDGVQVSLPLPSPGNIENALAAWAVCSRFGLTVDDFARAVKTIPPVPMRTELLQIGTLTVVNDCYNANPASMKNALMILAHLSSRGDRRPVFICGDMAELGPQSRTFHNQLGSAIAQAKVQLLIATGEFAAVTTEAAKKNADYDLQTKSFKDALSACNKLAKLVKDYDIILVKGSRVAKMEMVIEKLKRLFDG